MNSDEIFQAIQIIAGNPSKKAKEELIALHGRDQQFKAVLIAALDPMITYGIAKVPNVTAGPRVMQFDDGTRQLLSELSKRVLTGNAARDALVTELADLTPNSGELLKRIITKDLRAGFTEGTVNRALPGLIQTFDCQLAFPYDVGRVKSWPVYMEPKVDGVRTLAFVRIGEPSTARFFSRSGKEFTTFEVLKQPLISAFESDRATEVGMEFVVDCEVVSGNFNKTVSEVRKKSAQITDGVLVVFDVLTREEFENTEAVNSRDLPYVVDGPARMMAGFCTIAPGYEARRDRVTQVFPSCTPQELASKKLRGVRAMPSYPARDTEEVHAFFEAWLDLGLEGGMAKIPFSLYRKDRDYSWMKLKAEETVDLPIVGAEEGEGKYAGTLGALILDFNGVDVRASGMSDKLRDEMWAAYLRDLQKVADEDKELLGRLSETLYHEVTPDGSLRHPRFKRFRDDKVVM